MDPRFFRRYLDILSEQSQPPLDIAGTEYRQGGVKQLGIQPSQQDIQGREQLAGTLQTIKSLDTGPENQITYTDPRVNSIVGNMQQDQKDVEKRLAIAGVGIAPAAQPTQPKTDFSQYNDDDVAASPAQPTAAPAQPAQPTAADAINRVLDTQPAQPAQPAAPQPAAPTAAAKPQPPAQPATAPTAAAKPQPPAQPAAQTKTNSGGNVQEDTVRNQNNQQMDSSFFRRYLDIMNERVVAGQPGVQLTGPEPTDDQEAQDEETQKAALGLPSKKANDEAIYQRQLKAYQAGDNRGAGPFFKPRPGDEIKK